MHYFKPPPLTSLDGKATMNAKYHKVNLIQYTRETTKQMFIAQGKSDTPKHEKSQLERAPTGRSEETTRLQLKARNVQQKNKDIQAKRHLTPIII